MNRYDFFYGKRVNRFQFLMLPKVLLEDSCFKTLSYGARILYVILLDMVSLAQKQGQCDIEGRTYITYSIVQMQNALDCSRSSAFRYLQELEDIGMVVRHRKKGLNNTLYIMDFTTIID